MRIFLFNIFEHAPELTKDFTWPDELMKGFIKRFPMLFVGGASSITHLHFRNGVGDMSPVQAFGQLTQTDIDTISTHMLGRAFTERTADVSFERGGTRFRVNISRTIHGVTLAYRLIPQTIPEPEAI